MSYIQRNMLLCNTVNIKDASFVNYMYKYCTRLAKHNRQSFATTTTCFSCLLKTVTVSC